jgi:sec-independent protein translocase protein TatA
MNGLVIAGMIGGWEMVAILAVVVLIFGGRKIPELMRGLGKGVSEFKKGVKEAETSINEDKNKDTQN